MSAEQIIEQGEDPGLRRDECRTAGAAAGDGSSPAGATASTGASAAAGTSSGRPAGPESAPTSPSSGGTAHTNDEQPEVYLKRQKRANAVMGDVGVKADDARHQLVHTATGGATESTGRLTAWQVEAIVAFCDRLKMSEDGGRDGETRPAPRREPSSDHSAPADRDNAVEPQVVGGSTAVPGEWRARAAEQGVTDGQLLIMARDVAGALGVTPPGALKNVTDEVAAGVLERLG